MQWFKTLGEIYWNCATLTMRFNHQGQEVTLQALLNVADTGDQETLTTEQQQELTTLLQQFQQLFVEPTKLPPRRKSDHKIILINDTPVCLKPYRYPHAQKEEIERQVQGLLEKGFIRESTSSYASPLVLVKKKDGSWRCCTDFRKLNAFTIKNKFPMPLIEDLLDELNGECYFSKLDLRSGYNQVRMAEEDIHKTAFRTHSYYRRFILNYGKIAAPLTELLKKEKAFKWTEETAVAFQKLKQALMSAPVLRLPDFKQPFTIETDASGGGIGAVLLQNGHPIAIEYKKGKENVVADTLSRVGQNASVAAILHFSSRLMTEAIESWKTDPKLHKLVDKIRLTQQPYKHYTFQGVLLKRKGKVVVGAQQDLRNKILSHFHDSSIGGHSGVDLTYRRIKEQFYWKGLQRDVKRWIRECATCQRFK
uniref:Transposon Ty3-G Gag-Pol polyprotein n=1 Tax=Cajanus cajan TaxID=3821 RepID=A0A151RP00_CAJCA|nr:Transposon Ty3-G Gag-Pol polyprotein [Cajanus cajan]